ncbi:MAG: DUF4215 domain-containing protein [Myxococcales bacterium]|nr:DUF4215 domain-containing protein [Myxococcales bacterium]
MRRLQSHTTAAALGVALLGACSFDRTALEERPPCAVDGDCATGSVCVSGSCWSGPLADIGGGDSSGDVADSGDAGADATDGGCSPGQRACDGDQLVRCGDDGAWEAPVACSDTAGCSGEACVCRGGECVDGACTPGERRCDGDVPSVCRTDGSGFDAEAACGDDERCLGGVCVERACTPGDEYCAGESIVRCSPDATPSVFADCSASNAYCDEVPTPHCEPWACTPGTSRCADALSVEECDPRGDGYDAATACDEGEACDDGECVELPCLPGTQTCVGPLVYATCRADGAAPDVATCEDGTYCRELGDGAVTCAPQVCTPGDRHCVGDGGLEICDDRGSGFTVVVDCDGDEYCDDAVCVPRLCVPDAVRCVGEYTLGVCDGRGASETVQGCEADTYCDPSGVSAVCVPQVCLPGELRCGPDGVETCDSRGTGFGLTEPCDDGFTCDANACAPVICAPSSFECLDDFTIKACNERGTDWASVRCESTRYCDGGACVPQVCTPEGRSCEGDEVLECDARGGATTVVETCEFGCGAGACATDVCGNGIVGPNETCDDANTNPCDGCDACHRPSVFNISPTTLTVSDVRWTPGTADFTLEAWIRTTSAEGAWFGVGPRSGTDYIWFGAAGGQPRFEVALEAGVVLRLDAPTNIADGVWHHVVAERLSVWGLAIFVDGEPVAFSHAPVAQRAVDGALRIWLGSDGSTTGATASLDEVRYSLGRRYARAFTPERRLSADGTTLALYHFDDTNAADASGNGRGLVLTGGSISEDTCLGASAEAVRCGDGVTARWEECDDGNAAAGDGCDRCRRETCGAGWIRGAFGRCYRVEPARGWTDQRSACRGAGGDLATINNERENDWIVYMLDLSAAAWIGLNDRGWEGTYEWSNGEDAGYRHWASGEPNDGGSWTSSEDCVQIWPTAAAAADQWNDQDCGSSLQAVCERSPP